MNKNTSTDTQPTKAIIHVANKKLEFSSLRLEQAYGEHHSFCIKADFDVLKQSFMSNSKDYFELLGQTADIDIQRGDDNADVYKFRGIVQHVAVETQEDKHDYLVIKGASPTILMENGKRYDVFTDLTLKQVVTRLTENIIKQKDCLPVVNNPAYMEQIEFLMQYDESNWQFLRRLCCIAKENMYWTGQELVFGLHKDSSAPEVISGRELVYLQFSGWYLPNHFPHYQHLPESDAILKKGTPNEVKGEDKSVNMLEQEIANPAYDTIYISGTSKTAHPRIGHLLKVNMPDATCAATEPGTFRITKVIHEFDRNDHYECQFEGIQANLKYYPFLDVSTPVAESIPVQVVSSADPEGQGRVKVKFLLDNGRVSDVWLKVKRPSAVFTDDEKKNKSTGFTPEVGDRMMVYFESGDPNRPYVSTNIFHRKSGKIGIEHTATNAPMTQEDYKVVLKVRDKVYEDLDMIEQTVEEIKQSVDNAHQILFFKLFFETLLLVAQTEKGKKLFFSILEYVKTIDPDLSNKYWKIYDEQIDTILRSGYYKVNKNN